MPDESLARDAYVGIDVELPTGETIRLRPLTLSQSIEFVELLEQVAAGDLRSMRLGHDVRIQWRHFESWGEKPCGRAGRSWPVRGGSTTGNDHRGPRWRSRFATSALRCR